MKNSIFVAGIAHETHSFLDERTALSDFSQFGWGSDHSIDVPGSPMAAALRCLESNEGNYFAGPYFFAMPSGIVEDAVVSHWKTLFAAAWEANGSQSEAIFLVLHGAMVSQSSPDVEAAILEWIRELPGAEEIPIYSVLDLHGNLSSNFAEKLNGFLAYRENPHADAGDAAVRVMELLLSAASSGNPHTTYWRGTNLIWIPTGTGTALCPMCELEAVARRSEKREGIAGVNVFAGYSYADMPDTGVSFSVVAEKNCDPALAKSILDELEALASQMKAQGNPLPDSVEDLLQLVSENPQGPIMVAEPSDNIGAGAPGDGTGLLRIFIDKGISGAGVIINDPAAVSALKEVEAGQEVAVMVGGKGSRLDPGPLEVKAQVIRAFNGRFSLEDPRSHQASLGGTNVDMGECALIQVEGVTILLTTRKTPPFDLGQWRIAGVDPETFSVIAVKSAVAYRQAYDPIASRHLTLDTPGPCQLDLKTIPFQKVRRPVYPLDAL